MKIVKKKIIWSAIIGLAALALFILNVFQNGGDSWTTGFTMGIVGISIMRLIQYYRIYKDPQLLRKYEIGQKEERYISIAQKSGHFTFLLTIMVEFIGIFILILLYKSEIATIVSFVAGIQILIYLLTYYYLCKKY